MECDRRRDVLQHLQKRRAFRVALDDVIFGLGCDGGCQHHVWHQRDREWRGERDHDEHDRGAVAVKREISAIVPRRGFVLSPAILSNIL